MRLITLTLPLVTLLAGPALAQSAAPASRTTQTQNPFAPGSAAKPAPAPVAQPSRTSAPTPAQKRGAAAPAGAVFPTAISPRYASEPAGTGRQKTCLDQYNANKTAGGAGNGGLNWIQTGGGYWSECNKRLKG
jgi:hypothetical protein